MMDLIRTLSKLPGISGQEDAVREEILSRLASLNCQIEVDALGSIIATKKGARPANRSLLFSAHMDEVGFIITYIEEDGTLRFAPVGGIDSRVVVGKTLLVGPDQLPGVVGRKAVHQQSEEERERKVDFPDLYIDIGALSKEEAEQKVRLGTYAIFAPLFFTFGDGFLCGKALDDRAGCALLLKLLEEDLPIDITCSFSVMEETGCQGAAAIGHRVQPDLAIVLETTTASDIPGVAPDRQVCHLGNGPTISFMDRGTIYSADVYQDALRLCEEKGIPVQSKAGVYGGNESRNFQTAANGAKTLAVSLPCRYLHSPTCVLKESDIDATLEFLKAFLAEESKR